MPTVLVSIYFIFYIFYLFKETKKIESEIFKSFFSLIAMLQFEVILIYLLYIELGVTKKENIPKSKRTPFSFNKRRKYGREDHSSPPEKQQAEHNEHNMGSLYEFILHTFVDIFF